MILEAAIQFLASYFGTIAFSVIFYIPREHYPCCGLIGGAGWMLYWWMTVLQEVSYLPATFLAAAFVVFLSRICGVIFKCPTTIFLSAGIFPLVPGIGIYRTVYYLIIGEIDQGSLYGRQTIGTAIAIVLGIIFVFEIPQQGIAWIAKLPKIIRKKKR
ncbi:MAG: threonine/serine exporter family protein [Ruminococcus sp.]|jgi:uncharacterized membrane protein YjjB (DUF3815 family)